MAEREVESVIEAIRDAVPRLRANGQEAEDKRWLPEENIALLEKAGVFRAATPRRFGGLDLSLPEQADVLREISRGCGSTGWVSMVWMSSAGLATLFPDAAQDEVFAGTSVRISGGFTPSGTLTRTEGGYLLNGTWRFNTGCRGADWNIAAAILQEADGSHSEAVAILPMDQFSIADDWNTSAAAATGSSSTTAKDVFVPEHRVISYESAILNNTPGRTAPVTPGRGYRLFSYIMAVCAGTYVGLAEGALELFRERVPGRGITYTSYEDQSSHPLTQIQVATAHNKIAAARALLDDQTAMLQRHADAGGEPSEEEKAHVRGKTSFAIDLCREAVDILYSAGGASVIQRNVPLQRFFRDARGLALHGLLLASTNLEVQGRVLLGHDPETPFL
ncbi:acyl-CoA dehydrogenase family protein [Streptomyces marincola]|uniref:acyl-CoA dehydrogenase family protein n=1 Tax=Streptomyces marincola TaxID=2878388 RepID=UPI001CF5C4AE|nr:acyl-CoA dehydrogenase family protein [Streptomyces marincola]UCM87577.1 acyl-CoA dehydrogenase family protein [Streptomyces marincola]